MRNIEDLTSKEISEISDLIARSETIFQSLIVRIARNYDINISELYDETLKSLILSCELIVGDMEKFKCEKSSIFKFFNFIMDDLK